MDEVGEGEAAVRVLLGNADHQSEVGVDQGLFRDLCVGTIEGDQSSHFDFVIALQQRDFAHTFEVFVQERISGSSGTVRCSRHGILQGGAIS